MSCEILADWDDIKDMDDIDQCECPYDPIGKFEYKGYQGLTNQKWLCKKHKERYDIIQKIK